MYGDSSLAHPTAEKQSHYLQYQVKLSDRTVILGRAWQCAVLEFTGCLPWVLVRDMAEI